MEPLVPVFAKREVWAYPFGRGLGRDETEVFVRHQVDHWEALGFGLWLATTRAEGTCIGFVGLSVPTFLPSVLPAVEVGWRLDPDAWGRGYATEAATAALEHAFQTLGLDRVVSLPQVDNPRSVAVAERIGMRLDRTETAPATDRRGPVDVAVMVVTHRSWDRGRAERRG